MNLERQSILRSALDFVSAMTQGKVSNLEEGFQSEIRDDSPVVTEFTAPPPEIFYMLLKGKEVPHSPCSHVLKEEQSQQLRLEH